MEQHLPTEISVDKNGVLRTVEGATSLNGALMDWGAFPFSGGALTAHLKTDPISKEAIGVSYASAGQPSARVSTLSGDGTVQRTLAVPLRDASAQVMIHDTAITCSPSSGGGWVVILDLPLTIRPARMLRDKFPVEYEPTHGARIGLLPRSCTRSEDAAASTVWINVEPCVVLHTVNAYERAEDGMVILTALRSLPTTPESFIAAYSSAFLYEWVLDPSTGVCVSERILSARPLEFPAIDPRLVGQQTKFAYGITPRTAGAGPGGLPNRFGPPGEGILIDGVAKFDLTTGEQVASWTTDAGYWITSEPTFVPKLGSTAGDGDAGYIFVFCTAVEPADGTPLTGAERAGEKCVVLHRAPGLVVVDLVQLPLELVEPRLQARPVLVDLALRLEQRVRHLLLQAPHAVADVLLHLREPFAPHPGPEMPGKDRGCIGV